MPVNPPSRPSPDCLTPPKGAEASESPPLFTATMPDSIASAAPSARVRFSLNT